MRGRMIPGVRRQNGSNGEIRSYCRIYRRAIASCPGNLPSRHRLLGRRVHDHVRGLRRRGIAPHRWVGVVPGAALGRGVPRAGVGLRCRADGQQLLVTVGGDLAADRFRAAQPVGGNSQVPVVGYLRRISGSVLPKGITCACRLTTACTRPRISAAFMCEAWPSRSCARDER